MKGCLLRKINCDGMCLSSDSLKSIVMVPSMNFLMRQELLEVYM